MLLEVGESQKMVGLPISEMDIEKVGHKFRFKGVYGFCMSDVSLGK